MGNNLIDHQRYEICYRISSLHKIILNVFLVVLVLWRLLFLVEAFSFCHSCSKKLSVCHHNTKMTQNTFNIFVVMVWVALYCGSVGVDGRLD